MAQAQVTITAVDRTQAAINSAVRGMKSIERTAKVTAKAVNLAFGFFTGGVLISAFGKIIEAAKKTEEGTKSVENLKKTLQDPALVAAANSISKSLIDGFTTAAGGIAAFARLVRSELLRLGAIEVQTAEDGITILQQKIDAIRKKYQTSVKGEVISSPISKADLDLIAEYERRLAAIRENAEMTRGPSRRGQVSVLAMRRGQLAAEAVALKNQEEAAEKARKVAEKFAQEIDATNKRTQTAIESTVAAFESFKKDIDILLKEGVITPDVASKRLREQLDEILPEVDVTGKREIVPGFKEATSQMQEFAKQAAQNIQSSFADFLFDPFENGLRGMLSGFLNVIRRMVAEIAAQEILKAIFLPFASGSGFFANFAKSLTGKAMGGPVSANTPYIVGERGPELFVPGTSGGIVPNNKLGMGGGVTVAPVYNIDARGASADLQRALPGILQENNRRIFDELDRRYGIGR